jgi:hypothetical protein
MVGHRVSPIAFWFSLTSVIFVLISADVMAQQDFIVRLNNFQIFDTTSPHNDTDYAYFSVAVGNQMFGPRHAGLGSLNNGLYNLNWEVPITVADDTTPVIISYQIVNNGASDQHQQIQNDAAILGGIGNVLSAAGAAAGVGGSFTGPVIPLVGVVVGVLGGVVGAIGNAIQALDGMVNCDEAVVNDAFVTTRSTILAALPPTGFQTLIKDYHTPGRSGGLPIWLHCRTAHYVVSWSILPSNVRIDNRNSNLSMDVADASLLDGAAVNQFTTQNGANQRWRLIPVDAVKNPHPIAIVSVNSGEALDVPNGSRNTGIAIQQYSLNYAHNQLWLLSPSPDNQSVQIVNVNSTLALDVPGLSTTSGTAVQQNKPGAALSQQWFMVPDAVGTGWVGTGFVSVPLLRGSLIPVIPQ